MPTLIACSHNSTGEELEICVCFRRARKDAVNQELGYLSACVRKASVGLERRASYSYLRATIGSTRIARRAGR